MDDPVRTSEPLAQHKNLRTLRALYENGWAVGKIMYHNRALGKYFVQYENDSDLLDQKRSTMLKFNCFDVAFHVCQ